MTAWISCAERMPEMATDQWGPAESRWVLVRTRRGEVYVARLRQYEDDDAQWIARGPDGYNIEDVTEWCEVPE